MSASNIYGSYAGRGKYDYGYGAYDSGAGDQTAQQSGTPYSGGYGGGYGGYGQYGDTSGSSRFPTHYGQVCCYDEKGFLMQTTYQPVIKVIEETPYNPGFPLRAYEFGTQPYMGQFEVPGLSAFHHDYMVGQWMSRSISKMHSIFSLTSSAASSLSSGVNSSTGDDRRAAASNIK
jgi:hypothetical protein